MMYARLLPHGDRSLLTSELVGMGHLNPGEVLQHLDPSVVAKLIRVPTYTAQPLLHWLRQQESDCRGYSVPGSAEQTLDILLTGTIQTVSRLRQAAAQNLLLQPVVEAIDKAFAMRDAAPLQLLLGDTALPLKQRAYVMGILNVTPDSFFDGGLYLRPEQAIKHAEEMLAEGADVIDVGGQSSRPGALPVPAEVERQRVVPVVREIVNHYGVPVSVDTYRASVAEAALDVGAVLINDISAMRFDHKMAPLLARSHAAVVLMHMQGIPQTMQQSPVYHHVIDDVYDFLSQRLALAMQHGMARQRILLDPGIGFGKRVQHNLDLLRGLAHLQALGQPLMIGTSRKSFLGALLQREVWDRLEGTIASVVYAVLRGAAVVRVHDVKPVVQALRLIDALGNSSMLS